jgi:hypothetical protein
VVKPFESEPDGDLQTIDAIADLLCSVARTPAPTPTLARRRRAAPR